QSASPLTDAGMDVAGLKVPEAAQAMGFDDIKPSGPLPPDTTIILNEEFRLSGEEEMSIRKLVDKDAEYDLYESTAEILREMLHQETELDGFGETATICERVTSEFLRLGRLAEAAHLLKYLQELEEKSRYSKPRWAERLKQARDAGADRDRLMVFADALNKHETMTEHDLRAYLDNFDWQALNRISELLGELNHEHHRRTLCDVLVERGRSHPDLVGKGVYDKRWYVVRNTVSILARIGTEAALRHLEHAVAHGERRVRQEIVSSLKENDSDRVLKLLATLARDEDCDIRREAISAVASRRGAQAFDTIVEMINDDRFPDLDESEQRQLLNAYSELGGEKAVGFLSRLILHYNPFRSPLRTFYRRAAFEALSYNRSEKAEKLLIKLTSSWRPDIRRQAVAALKQRREHLFMGV
ncbi:MAG: HEAT repeat domain-containing protein, partial [Candidatus Zixiibacteriota bacterium]